MKFKQIKETAYENNVFKDAEWVNIKLLPCKCLV